MSDHVGTTRRSALVRVALLAAGALGIGYAAREATDGGTVAAGSAAQSSKGRTIYGRDWRLHSPNRVPGERPPLGDHPTPQGRLVDQRGHPVGAFSSAAVAGAGGSLELHTFDLAEGQIFGVGAGLPGQATFAIIGGTGRYSGARGSYVARQSFRELGGDGTAEFTLTLDDLEA
ncbi:MAG: hypothetical protein ACXWYS_03215 [Gaiellaceae bacterium]